MESASQFYDGKFDRLLEELKDPEKSKYVSLNPDLSKITFSRNKEDLKSEKYRQEQSLGRFLVRNVESAKEFSTSEIDGFVKKTFEFVSPDIKSKEFEDIEDRYREYGYTNDFSRCPLSSCVGGVNSYAVRVFGNNTDKVKVFEFYGGSIRALLWTCDDGSKVLDRLYPSGHKHNRSIIGWAKQNNIITRNKIDSLDIRDVGLSDGSQRFVTLNIENITALPYMDTFKFCEIDIENQTAKCSNKPIAHKEGFIYKELIVPPATAIPTNIKLNTIDDVAKMSFYDLKELYEDNLEKKELIFEAAKKHVDVALQVIADSDATPSRYLLYFLENKDIKALNVLAYSRFWYGELLDKLIPFIGDLNPDAQKTLLSNISGMITAQQINAISKYHLDDESELILIQSMLYNRHLGKLTFDILKSAITNDNITEDDLLSNRYIILLSKSGYYLSDIPRYNSLKEYVETHQDIFGDNDDDLLGNGMILFANKEMLSVANNSNIIKKIAKRFVELYVEKYSLSDLEESMPDLVKFVDGY